MTASIFAFSPNEVMALARANMPLLSEYNISISYESEDILVQMGYSERMTRPGGIISGPTLMALGDLAVWVAILSRIGPDGVMAVTSDLNASFLRALRDCDLIARTRILKFGRRLVHGDVIISTVDKPDSPGCHVSATYARP